MEVYFGTNFWDDRKTGAPLDKIPVHGAAEGDMLAWGNKKVRIPAVYVGREGAVLDLCICVPLSDISEYMERTSLRLADILTFYYRWMKPA